MSQTVNVNGVSINYPETGDTGWGDEGTAFAVQTSSALSKLGLSTGTTVDLPGTLDVTGATTLDSNLSVGGNSTLTGNLTVNGNTILGNATSDTITITGSVAIDTNVLIVDPTNNRVGINKTSPAQALDVVGAVAISGNETVGGTLGVTGNTTLSGTLGVTGNTTLSGTLGVTGNTTLTGQLLNSDGTASLPGISFTNDSDCGIYRIGSNNLGLAVNATKIADIQSLGILNGSIGTDYRNLLQNLIATSGTVATGTNTIPYDNTIPQITEGNEFLSLSITPKNSSSILEIEYQMMIASSTTARIVSCIFKSGVNNALAVSTTYSATNSEVKIFTGKCRIISGNTSLQTFSIRAGMSSAGTTTINGEGTTQYFGGTMNSYIIIKEFY